jgi:hypothetical protein
LDSIVWWAAFKYGIDISRWLSKPAALSKDKKSRINGKWDDIEIKIKNDHQIAYSHKKGKWVTSSFEEIGLLDRRSRSPNYLAAILIGLSAHKKFPKSITATPKDKTAICRLRDSLVKLTGLDGDPFYPVNAADGWKPKFRLVDDRRNADKRARRSAKHQEYDDGKSFEDEKDAADEWLQKLR